MGEFLNNDYETLKQKTRYVSWAGLKLACDDQAVEAPSYKTFCIAVKKRPVLDQTLKRQGRRASYQLETFYWELDLKTPRHGDRPFEIVHIDHTELDVETVASTGQNLGRPWITIATDAYSRRTLSFYLSPVNEAQGDSRARQEILTIGEQVRGAASRRPATRGRVHPA
jgi:hypothetical protein